MSNRAKLLALVFVTAIVVRLIMLAVLLPKLKPDVGPTIRNDGNNRRGVRFNT